MHRPSCTANQVAKRRWGPGRGRSPCGSRSRSSSAPPAGSSSPKAFAAETLALRCRRPEARLIDERRGQLDFAAFAAHLGEPAVHDAGHGAWSFGPAMSAKGGSERPHGSGPVAAPDFSLPDLERKAPLALGLRGRKVFLFCWPPGEAAATTCRSGRRSTSGMRTAASRCSRWRSTRPAAQR